MSTATEHEDPRRARSRASVLEAAIAILRESGQPGLTIEAVAARSRVAKTTIYRHFADRDELHIAALQAAAPEIRMPRTDDVVHDVVGFCVALNDKLQHTEFGSVLATAIDGAERSESLAEILAGVGAERRRALDERLRLAQQAGALAADLDVGMLNSQLVGPLFFRRFISRQATSSAFVAEHVQMVLSPRLQEATIATAAGGGERSRSTR
ncbi:MAG: TetR/AcrR family transcriptional regulator [Actinomycetota bacterium]|nr:TetR/AcrR family transcriptional regulator [Actinomycetota bacterium]